MKRCQMVIGAALIVLGVFSLLDVLFDIDLGRFLGPLILIGLGLLLILRPKMAGNNVQVQMPILGEVRKTGTWQVDDLEIWWLVGSNLLDFRNAEFSPGVSIIKLFGFVTDVDIILPEDVGLDISAMAFISEFKGLDHNDDRFLSALQVQSPNFDRAEKKVRLESVAFVSELKVKSDL